MTDDEKYESYQNGSFLNHTYWTLAEALGYPKFEPGRIEADLYEVLADAVHMIELGHLYLDAEEKGIVSRWKDRNGA